MILTSNRGFAEWGEISAISCEIAASLRSRVKSAR
jgi:hypothetical protein